LVIPFLKGLLLLQQLNKGNAAIQKIVAFENAFERLLDVIAEEGYTDGGEFRPSLRLYYQLSCTLITTERKW